MLLASLKRQFLPNSAQLFLPICSRLCSTQNTKHHDEFTQKREDERAEDEQRTRDDDEDESLRGKILSSSLQFVPAYGWTRAAVEAGTETLGYPSVTSGIIRDADIQLVRHHVSTANTALATSMRAEAGELGDKLRVAPFIRRNVEKRLRMNAPYLSRWSEAVVIQSYPQHAPGSLQQSLDLMDLIWHHAGCKSTDFNWYTKRLSLLAIYKTSELAMVNDKSEDFAETWEFLDRRMADTKSLSNLVVSPEDLAKLAGAVGSTLQAFLGVKR